MADNMILFQTETVNGVMLDKTNRDIEKITVYNYPNTLQHGDLACAVTRDMENVIDLAVSIVDTVDSIYEFAPLNKDEKINFDSIHFIRIGFTPDAKAKTCLDAFKNMFMI